MKQLHGTGNAGEFRHHVGKVRRHQKHHHHKSKAQAKLFADEVAEALAGNGLSDLIREEFGLRLTFVMMMLLVATNFANVMAEFAGVASSMELFHVSKYLKIGR